MSIDNNTMNLPLKILSNVIGRKKISIQSITHMSVPVMNFDFAIVFTPLYVHCSLFFVSKLYEKWLSIKFSKILITSHRICQIKVIKNLFPC